MEGLPSGDIQAKYQKLATEYSKLRVHVKVLKKGVLDEQAKSNELRDQLKEKDKSLRKGELEIDSLTFRNQQLTRRVSVLQDELEALQLKQNKKSKSKSDDKQSVPSSSAQPLDSGLLQEELQKKIIENAQFASQLSDARFEVSQLRASLEEYARTGAEADGRYKCELARLRGKNQELQRQLEEAQKERVNSTPRGAQPAAGAGSQAPSCNGDLYSEAGSLMGSEDALSSVGDLNINEQLSMKALEQENQKLRMEYELVVMANESLRLEVSRHESAAQRRRGDAHAHDSGDFDHFATTALQADGKITGLLGSLEVPFLLSHEVETREERVKAYFRNMVGELKAERDDLKSKTEHYVKECELLRLRFEELERDRQADARTIEDKHRTISRLEEELHSTSHNYEEQMCVLTEHVAGLNEQLAAQHDRVHQLQHQLSARRK